MKNLTLHDAEVALALFDDTKPSTAIRHQLSSEENLNVRAILQAAFSAVKSHVQSFVREDVTPEAMFKSSMSVFDQSIENNPLCLKLVEADNSTSLGGLVHRDVGLWSIQFRESIFKAANMDEAQQKAVLNKSRRLDQFGPYTSPQNNSWPAYRDALSLDIANIVLKPITQPEIDIAARLMSARFGLDGVKFQDDRFDNRQQLRWIEKAGDALQESCKRLGIAEMDFGRRGGVSLEIMSPPIAQKMGFAGQFFGTTWPGSKILLDLTNLDLAGVATHEFAHMLDYDLGLKAVALAHATDSAKGWNLMSPNSHFFSRLPGHIQAMIPEAKKGLDTVFSALSSESLMTHVDALLAKHSASDPAAGALNASRVYEKEAALELETRLNTLADRFLIKTVGEERLMALTKEEFKALRKDLRSDNDHILVGLASELTSSPVGMCVFRTCSPDFDGGRPAHPFMAKLEEMHGSGYLLKTMDAVNDCKKQFGATAAMIHAVNRGSLPSKMIEESINVDMNRMQAGHDRPYLSQEIEIFARAIGRPKDFMSLVESFKAAGYLSPLSGSKAKDLNRGLAAMTKAAGHQPTTKGPDLSMGFERTINAASVVFRAPLTVASSFLKMLGSKEEPAARRYSPAP